jgi:hypothetical protein
MRNEPACERKHVLQGGTDGVMNHMSQTSHSDFDELISMLRAEGHDQVAQRLHMLLHEVAWTSSSELMGELGLEIAAFRRSTRNLSPELEKLICRCLDVVKKVWPDIEKAGGTRCS